MKQKINRMAQTIAVPVLAAAALLGTAACDNTDYSNASPFDNVVYIDAAEIKDIDNFTFNRTVESGKRTVSAQLMRPTDTDINVGILADESLVADYNARLGTDYTMLDSKYWKLSAEETVIGKGKVTSDPVTVDFLDLTGLEIDKSYLLPVTISHISDGMEALAGSKTICYVVRRSSSITSAVSLSKNYFTVPGFAKGSPTADVVNNLNQLTFEAIIRVNSFKDGNRAREISTIMGVEQYCLLRLGDAGFNPQQLQFAANEVKFPGKDNSKSLREGEWYHVAVTYDAIGKTAVMYVDGQEQSRAEDYGKGEPMNLGMQKPESEPGKKDGDFMFKIGHSYGDPDDMSRMLDGEICEVRIWNTVRTQEEIYGNMYSVEPTTPGLCSYWKFDEGKGDVVKDYTGNGNDAHAYEPAYWPSGIEVTRKDKE